MKATISQVTTDATPVRIELVMTLGEMRDLREQLTSRPPSWKFSAILEQAIGQTIAHFEATDEAKM